MPTPIFFSSTTISKSLFSSNGSSISLYVIVASIFEWLHIIAAPQLEYSLELVFATVFLLLDSLSFGLELISCGSLIELNKDQEALQALTDSLSKESFNPMTYFNRPSLFGIPKIYIGI